MLSVILLVVFGAFALAKGEFKITARRKVKGSTSRALGIVLLIAAGLSLTRDTTLSLIALGLFIAVVVIGLTTSEKIRPDTSEMSVEETGSQP